MSKLALGLSHILTQRASGESIDLAREDQRDGRSLEAQQELYCLSMFLIETFKAIMLYLNDKKIDLN